MPASVCRRRADVGTLKDWEWGLGVNFWGPIYGVNTFVPRMLASKQGCRSSRPRRPAASCPAVAPASTRSRRSAAVALMEELRHELREIEHRHVGVRAGTHHDQHRPERELSARGAEERGRACAAPGGRRRQPARPPAARSARTGEPAARLARPQDPLVVGRFVLDGILHNDLFIVLQPEWRPGRRGACQCAARIDGAVHADARRR